MSLADRITAKQVRQETGIRLPLREWDTIRKIEVKDDSVLVIIETFEVKVLRREDRFNKHGVRMLHYTRQDKDSAWYIDFDQIAWDEDFVPYVFDKTGRKKTSTEEEEQREFEKLCYRPGTKQFPLDNYARVWNDPSTRDMERYW